MKKEKTTSEQFCQDILKSLDIKYAKAFTNTAMALASQTFAHSVVELSESPLFHHQYSSLRDGITGIGKTLSEQNAVMSAIRALGLAHLAYEPTDWLVFQTDATSIVKAHSDCLADRQYIKIANNVIKSNKPISIGYPVSLVNVSCPVLSNKWSVPISIKRISSIQSAVDCAVAQVQEILEEEALQLVEQSLINTLDSGYGCAAYLAPTYEHKNLVNIVRFRYGKKVWLPAEFSSIKEATSNKGTPLIFGEKYYLTDYSQMKTFHRKGVAYEVYQRSIFDLAPVDYLELDSQTSKGRKLKILIWRWNDTLMRTKNGHNMKNKFFDIVASKVVDADTGELVFNKTMFTTIHGERKEEITTQQAFETYRHRYDIEPSIKFCKQKLLLDKYQTPDQQHFDNWLVVVMTAYWLLYTAADTATYQPKKWQQYKPVNKSATEQGTILTPCQTRQAAESFFLTFDKEPFVPVKCKKGSGRKKGTPVNQRTRYKPVKKSVAVSNTS